MRLTPEETVEEMFRHGHVTMENVERVHEIVFAPWVKQQGLEFLESRKAA